MHGGGEDAAGLAGVEAHEAGAGSTEDGAVVEVEPGIVGIEVHQLLLRGEAQPAVVEEHKV